MAETIKKHDFPAPRSRQKYPWDEWLNGQIWVLRQGEDFEVVPANFASSAKAYGDRHEHIAAVNTDVKDGEVILQAVLAE
ncbi:MAG TPA: hypothetical protein VFO86_15655 [Terriglobia bacterium]|nr:hypothetical protein [Terriglobia bacterium]